MSAGWVAGAVRARAMSRRRVGAVAARDLAGRPSLELAVDSLADGPYGHDVRPGQTLSQAQHAVSATVLWNMRVLAGWLPTGASQIMRLLAGGFEVANVDEHLRELDGRAVEPPFHLGSLATTWQSAARAPTAADLRTVLARSPWGDPGSDFAGRDRTGDAAGVGGPGRLRGPAGAPVGMRGSCAHPGAGAAARRLNAHTAGPADARTAPRIRMDGCPHHHGSRRLPCSRGPMGP